ncbi:sporulation protein Cse60 [Haloplasma contractile]|uniref:Sporulation protein cse60 n=1 Tax=Haloplasma contractile SSD-17B TaxID=1033810 RepID=U2DYV5_9MOLU|nr:sporulation protein Cse60 [Haloplasma contractile]ERJ13422.1 Sporulation protein cse60 [Haloplasma contractile SSD-17B]
MGLKVKLFDEQHEEDLEEKMNEFLSSIEEDNLINVKYQITSMYDHGDMEDRQIYCFTAMVIYKE